ncbi:hypothetical protein ACIA5E_30765 [Nocardia asteroides]|uniref:hypothetical protein n=1 Tax=Nocardia asteroides TaxID=1824 RepID=UPI0037A4C534
MSTGRAPLFDRAADIGVGREKLCLIVDLGVRNQVEDPMEPAHRGYEIGQVVTSQTGTSDNDEVEVRPGLPPDKPCSTCLDRRTHDEPHRYRLPLIDLFGAAQNWDEIRIRSLAKQYSYDLAKTTASILRRAD